MTRQIPRDFEDFLRIIINFNHPDPRLFREWAETVATKLLENYFGPEAPCTDLLIGPLWKATDTHEEQDRAFLETIKAAIAEHKRTTSDEVVK